jgi:hypothetical protein
VFGPPQYVSAEPVGAAPVPAAGAAVLEPPVPAALAVTATPPDPPVVTVAVLPPLAAVALVPLPPVVAVVGVETPAPPVRAGEVVALVAPVLPALPALPALARPAVNVDAADAPVPALAGLIPVAGVTPVPGAAPPLVLSSPPQPASAVAATTAVADAQSANRWFIVFSAYQRDLGFAWLDSCRTALGLLTTTKRFPLLASSSASRTAQRRPMKDRKTHRLRNPFTFTTRGRATLSHHSRVMVRLSNCRNTV